LTTINFDAEQWELVAWSLDATILHQHALLALASGTATAHADTQGNPRIAAHLERLRKLVALRSMLPHSGGQGPLHTSASKPRLRAAMAMAKDDLNALPQKRDDPSPRGTDQLPHATAG